MFFGFFNQNRNVLSLRSCVVKKKQRINDWIIKREKTIQKHHVEEYSTTFEWTCIEDVFRWSDAQEKDGKKVNRKRVTQTNWNGLRLCCTYKFCVYWLFCVFCECRFACTFVSFPFHRIPYYFLFLFAFFYSAF